MPSSKKRKRKRTRRKNKVTENKVTEEELAPWAEETPVRGFIQEVTESAVVGAPGPSDNEYHLEWLFEPEFGGGSHTADLVAELTGQEEFDFEVDIDS